MLLVYGTIFSLLCYRVYWNPMKREMTRKLTKLSPGKSSPPVIVHLKSFHINQYLALIKLKQQYKMKTRTVQDKKKVTNMALTVTRGSKPKVVDDTPKMALTVTRGGESRVVDDTEEELSLIHI